MKPPWTWACLACNETGVGSSVAHRCPVKRPDYLYPLWLYRLQWAMPKEDAERVLQRPVERADLVLWFGERWRAEHTAPMGVVRPAEAP